MGVTVPCPFYQISHRYHSPPPASVVCFVMDTKIFSRQVFDILYVINMPSSSPTPSIPNPPTEKSQTARRYEKTANVTLGPYTAPSSLRAHNKNPPAAPAAELPPHLFCVTLTPPCHVPSPIKKARSKTRDSLDIFRRKRNKEHYNGCREEEKKNVTICTSKQEDEEEEEEEEAVSATWGNWSYTMSPVSLLTHLANEFMDKDKCPSPSPSRNSTRHIQSRQDDYARVQGRGRRRQRNRSPSLRLNTSSESAQGRRWRQATGLGTDGPGMARVKEKEKEMQVGKVGRISSSSSSSSSSNGGNESITHEYLKVLENDQDDEGPERYGAGYEGNKIIPDPEAESPEEWEWDRLLEEMEK